MGLCSTVFEFFVSENSDFSCSTTNTEENLKNELNKKRMHGKSRRDKQPEAEWEGTRHNKYDTFSHTHRIFRKLNGQ